MEGNKKSQYDHTGCVLLAFAIETFGGFDKQAVEITALLKAAFFSSSPLHFHASLSTAAAQMLAVALQRGTPRRPCRRLARGRRLLRATGSKACRALCGSHPAGVGYIVRTD